MFGEKQQPDVSPEQSNHGTIDMASLQNFGAGRAVCTTLEGQQPLLRSNMPELDSIRGLAIVAVLCYHGFFWQTDVSNFNTIERSFVFAMSAGRLGVNLFFVLSGFLITGLLIESRDRFDYYRRFYIRRALRILPAYYAILAILAVTQRDAGPFLLFSLIYLSNLTPLVGISISYGVLWSLAVEEHFYLLWPLIVRQLSLRRLALCAGWIVAITPFLRLLSFYAGDRSGFVSYVCNGYTWNASDGLACGALFAALIREFKPSRRQVFAISITSISVAALLWIISLPFGIGTRQRALGASLQVTPWNVVFAGLLGLFLLLGTSTWRFLVIPRILRFFGEISYGLYLVHVLIFEAYDHLIGRSLVTSGIHGHRFGALCVRFVCAASVAVIIAYVSRRWFENPFLRLKDRLSSGQEFLLPPPGSGGGLSTSNEEVKSSLGGAV